MILSLVVIVLLLLTVAFLVWDRGREREAQAKVLADLSLSLFRESRAERADLEQRIQAPEAAVLQHEQDTRPVPEEGPWQPWDVDTSDSRMTKEELAEAVDGRDG